MTLARYCQCALGHVKGLVACLAVWLGAACQLTIPIRCKLHGLVHVVLVLLWGEHQLHIWVDAAVALIGVAPHDLLAVHTGWGGARLTHRAGQRELQLTAVTQQQVTHACTLHSFVFFICSFVHSHITYTYVLGHS